MKHVKTSINHTETDAESKRSIGSTIDKDKQEHAGKNEATIHFVKQSQKD